MSRGYNTDGRRTLNGLFLRGNLFDFIDIIVAPVLVGGRNTPTLIDGQSLMLAHQLPKVKALQLLECKVLQGSYIRLRYKVIR